MEICTDVDLLLDAFETFKSASSTLENSYKVLEERVEEMDLELKEKNNFLTSIMEALPVGVVVTDERGLISAVNSTTGVILCEDGEALTGKSLEDKLLSLDARSGDTIGKGLSLNAFEVVDEQIAIKSPSGVKKTLTINSTALKNLQGESTGKLVVLRDVSEIKRLRESAQRDKRLKAMGEMAASIAHQIRNPLGSIELFASILSDELSADEENRKFASEIIHAVSTLNNTLSNMLLFANTSRPREKYVPIDEFILDIQGVYRFLMVDSPVRFEVVNQSAGQEVLIDYELMKQAVLNLIINAVDAAVGAKSDPLVKLEVTDSHRGLQFLISDNGCGLAPGDLDKVFDPFYTSKPSGTGLGLTVVSNIVNSHGGFVEAESFAGLTVFSITLAEHATRHIEADKEAGCGR